MLVSGRALLAATAGICAYPSLGLACQPYWTSISTSPLPSSPSAIRLSAGVAEEGPGIYALGTDRGDIHYWDGDQWIEIPRTGIPLQYPLQEHAEASYQPRTVQNLAAADFTAIFSRAPLSPGSRFTLDQCRRLGKPHLWLRHFPDVGADARLLRWALREFDGILNISGSRESKCPGMHQHVLDVLHMAIA